MFFSRKKKSAAQSENTKIDISAYVDKLINDFELEKVIIIEKAISVENFFNQEWDTFLLSWNINPRNVAEREDDVKKGVPLAFGALPIEVKAIFEELKIKYQAAASVLRRTYEEKLREEDEVEEKLWEFEHRELDSFVEKGVKKYLKKVKKSEGAALDNALKNAAQNQNKWSSNLQEAQSYMIRCKNCGAARLHTMQYDNCKFCGSELFEKIEK